MVTYYVLENDKIIAFDDDLEALKNSFLNDDVEILQTQRPIVDFCFADTDEFIEKQKEKEQERIAKLNLTAADVERAIYKAKGMDFEDIIALVESNPDIDLKALKIELKANNFFRGNPYINQIGSLLGFTSEQLDGFFESNDYRKLMNEGKNE